MSGTYRAAGVDIDECEPCPAAHRRRGGRHRFAIRPRRGRRLRLAVPLRPGDPPRPGARRLDRSGRHQAPRRAGARRVRHDRRRPRQPLHQRHRRLGSRSALLPRLPRRRQAQRGSRHRDRVAASRMPAPRPAWRSSAARPPSCRASTRAATSTSPASSSGSWRAPSSSTARRSRPATPSSVCRRPACTRTATAWRGAILPPDDVAPGDAGWLSARSARRCSSRIGPTSTRSGSCGVPCDVAHAVAHLTGGGWIENIPRTLPDGLGVEVEAARGRCRRIFTLIQSAGRHRRRGDGAHLQPGHRPDLRPPRTPRPMRPVPRSPRRRSSDGWSPSPTGSRASASRDRGDRVADSSTASWLRPGFSQAELRGTDRSRGRFATLTGTPVTWIDSRFRCLPCVPRTSGKAIE